MTAARRAVADLASVGLRASGIVTAPCLPLPVFVTLASILCIGVAGADCLGRIPSGSSQSGLDREELLRPARARVLPIEHEGRRRSPTLQSTSPLHIPPPLHVSLCAKFISGCVLLAVKEVEQGVLPRKGKTVRRDRGGEVLRHDFAEKDECARPCVQGWL